MSYAEFYPFSNLDVYKRQVHRYYDRYLTHTSSSPVLLYVPQHYGLSTGLGHILPESDMHIVYSPYIHHVSHDMLHQLVHLRVLFEHLYGVEEISSSGAAAAEHSESLFQYHPVSYTHLSP